MPRKKKPPLGPPPVPPPLPVVVSEGEWFPSTPRPPLTRLQESIMKALVYRALKGEELAARLEKDPSRMHQDGIRPLLDLGLIKNKSGLGYYRPDAPPP